MLATLDTWEAVGHAGASARGVAQRAALPTSSIYHHFGDLERLFITAQEQALSLSEAWCSQRLDELSDTATGAESLPAVFATLIDDWCEGQRRLAFAWRECQLQAARGNQWAEQMARWQRLWSDFWSEICRRLNRPDAALQTERLFDGESFYHLLRWRRPLDRAALDELSVGWGAWLTGRLAPPAPWRDVARRLAGASVPHLGRRGDDAVAIATAAAGVLARFGVGGVTHRSVAAEAGLTLGIVSHKFRTSADLLGAAFEIIYLRAVPRADVDVSALKLSERGAVFERASSEEFHLATFELMMATMRDPALRPFGAQLRYLRGRSAGRYLQAMLGPDRPISAVDAALFSSLATGRGHALYGLKEGERRVQLEAENAELLVLLGGMSA